jgi:hypothetical protein
MVAEQGETSLLADGDADAKPRRCERELMRHDRGRGGPGEEAANVLTAAGACRDCPRVEVGLADSGRGDPVCSQSRNAWPALNRLIA